ncbi:MAG: hypothetical protein E6I82_09285, partial [Chloroflexi bacterium]
MGRWAVLLVGVLLCSACGAAASVQSGTAITVVAGENFWGSIAAQLGGSKVTVQSVVTDPNADPHEYESSSSDARAFAEARLVILNGAGYDSWGQKLLDANKATNRRVLNIAELLGKKQGDNPHFWYDPSYVTRIADEITSDYKSIDPEAATYFEQQRLQVKARFQDRSHGEHLPVHGRRAWIGPDHAGRVHGRRRRGQRPAGRRSGEVPEPDFRQSDQGARLQRADLDRGDDEHQIAGHLASHPERRRVRDASAREPLVPGLAAQAAAGPRGWIEVFRLSNLAISAHDLAATYG